MQQDVVVVTTTKQHQRVRQVGAGNNELTSHSGVLKWRWFWDRVCYMMLQSKLRIKVTRVSTSAEHPRQLTADTMAQQKQFP